jgi:predicted RNase H-like nuclease
MHAVLTEVYSAAAVDAVLDCVAANLMAQRPALCALCPAADVT